MIDLVNWHCSKCDLKGSGYDSDCRFLGAVHEKETGHTIEYVIALAEDSNSWHDEQVHVYKENLRNQRTGWRGCLGVFLLFGAFCYYWIKNLLTGHD